MKTLSHIPVVELFNSFNGGISSCLDQLANWLAQDGREAVLREIEEMYEAAQSKRERECLFFLIQGISRIDVDAITHHAEQIKELFPALKQSNEAYEAKVERTGRTMEEWNAAAERFNTLLKEWSQWIVKSERLQLEDIRELTGSLFRPQQWNADLIFTPAFDSPLSLRHDKAFFMRKVDAVTQGIEQGHLANRLPEHLEVPDFYKAKEVLFALQFDCEKLAGVDTSVNEQDNALWNQYRERVDSLIKLLWTMDEAQLWSVFWFYHPEEIERPAISAGQAPSRRRSGSVALANAGVLVG